MNKTLKRTFFISLICILVAVSGAAIALSASYLYLSPNLPSVESIREVKLQTPLRIYSTDGKLIGEFGEKRRIPTKLENIPEFLIGALLSAEDADFYSHSGVSLRGLARAASELIITGERGSGGSTLTMQLTRNVFLSLEKKFIRKFNEILLSLKLERELTKDEILELYLNYMFLGKRAYGVQAAAQVYYGKELSELSLAQQAMIAGLFKGPSVQNPIVNPERAIERRNWILGRMATLGYINEQELELAKSEAVTAEYHGNQLEFHAPYVAELAREKAIRTFGLEAYTEGYQVYTTIASELQDSAQRAIVKGLDAYTERHGYLGPEQQLELPELVDEGALQALSEKILERPQIGNSQPALVLEVGDNHAELLLGSSELVTLTWENGLSDARRYLSENTRTSRPATASDVVNPGDIIRIKLNEEGIWQLTQIPKAQAALVSIDPDNGAILAMVGGYDFNASNFNRATQAYRQAGSSLKPFIYATAIENGLTPATLINDSPIVVKDADYEGTWRPKNDGDKFYGPMRLRKGLYLSRNLVSIRLLQQMGIRTATDALTRFGFSKSALPRDLSLALGNSSVTPLDMATAWAIFANGGYKVDAHLIHRVTDLEGNIVYEALPKSVCVDCDNETESDEAALPARLATSIGESDAEIGESDADFDEGIFEFPINLKRMLGLLEPRDYPRAPKVLDDQVSFLMDSILKDVIQRGTGRKARSLNRADLGGKTGTTNGPNDAWFSGYSRDIVTTTWLGFDQNTPLGNSEYGGSAALPIWIDFMKIALRDRPAKTRPQPPGIVAVKIDADTGERARIDDPDGIFEYFRMENVPKLQEDSGTDSNEVFDNYYSEDIF